MHPIVLAIVLMTTTAVATAPVWTPPAFCKGLDCPKYTVVKTLGDGVELRRYEAGSWVSVTAKGMDKDTAMRGSFMKLFDYISGANSQRVKIPMTAPVLTAINPGDGPNCESTFTMSFFQPYKYQGAKGVDLTLAPAPSTQGVYTTLLPAMEVYVLPYGGFSSASIERQKATELINKLKAAKEPYSTRVWYTAGYDSPYQLENRRNEIWIPSASTMGGAATATAAEAGKKAASGR